MLVGDAVELKIDLLSPSVDPTASAAMAAAIVLAAQRFQEQMGKSGVSLSFVRKHSSTFPGCPIYDVA
jgi:predicted regulator of Ras-like GTPase activity (Roadblock/LC7/MglB family)